MHIAARPLISLPVLAAMLAMPAMASARAKDQAATLAYDASLMQAAPDQPLPAATPTTAPTSSAPVSMVTAPDAYGTNTYNNPVSYNGEVQDADVATRRAATTRSGGKNATIQAESLDSGGEGDDSFAPGAMLPGQIGAFGARPIAGRRVTIRPYIEAQQVAYDQLSPSGGGGLLTYSVLAAGADVLVNGHATQGSLSVRYERRFGWGRNTNSGNSISGIAVASTRIAEGLRLDYGGYANRYNTSASGAAFTTDSNALDTVSQVYSVYAGPSISTHMGDVGIKGAYHASYTNVDSHLNGSSGSGYNPLNHSTAHDAQLSVGTAPGGLGLPVGVGVNGGYYREDVSNLDQRVSDLHGRAQIIVPVSPALNVMAGVGAEKVQVSSRDALRDASGNAIVGSNGALVTDPTSPRTIAFDTSGLIWDVGAQWRPSSRLSAEAHVGRRYGRLGGYGTLNWKPNSRTVFNVTVYESLTGFGGALATALSGTSTQFAAIRDSITGNLSSCVGSLTGGSCIGGATGSLNSQIYRGRGVTVSLMHDLGRWQVGVGGGWDRHVYIAAPDSVLAEINGRADQYYWVSGYAGGKVSQRSSIQTTLALYKFESGLVANGDMEAVHGMLGYSYYFTHHITANASVALDGMRRDQVDDLWTASGALGVRYSF